MLNEMLLAAGFLGKSDQDDEKAKFGSSFVSSLLSVGDNK